MSDRTKWFPAVEYQDEGALVVDFDSKHDRDAWLSHSTGFRRAKIGRDQTVRSILGRPADRPGTDEEDVDKTVAAVIAPSLHDEVKQAWDVIGGGYQDLYAAYKFVIKRRNAHSTVAGLLANFKDHLAVTRGRKKDTPAAPAGVELPAWMAKREGVPNHYAVELDPNNPDAGPTRVLVFNSKAARRLWIACYGEWTREITPDEAAVLPNLPFSAPSPRGKDALTCLMLVGDSESDGMAGAIGILTDDGEVYYNWQRGSALLKLTDAAHPHENLTEVEESIEYARKTPLFTLLPCIDKFPSPSRDVKGLLMGQSQA